jgi:hypothetical protein
MRKFAFRIVNETVILIQLGVKRSLQQLVQRGTSRLRRRSFSRSLSNPYSLQSLKSRGIEWLYLIIFLLLVAGVLNAITNAGTPGINSAPFVANPSIQNVTETFILLFAYILGALGAYSFFLSGRQTIRARSAEMFFVFGIMLISIALVLGYYIVVSK